MGDDRNAVYEDEENVFYRASSYGRCVRELAATRQGITPNAPSGKLQGYFDEGHDNEEEILDRFHDKIGKKTWERLGGQGEVKLSAGSYNGKKLWVVGHYDEMFVNRSTGETRLAEAKFLAPSSIRKISFQKPEPLESFPYYVWQRDIYMVAKRCGLWFVMGVKDRDDDGTANVADVIYHLFDKPINGIVAIIKRAREIEALAAGELPDCDIVQFPCSMYGSVCGVDELRDKIKLAKASKAKKDELEGDLLEAFASAVRDYEHGGVLEREGEAKKRRAIATIKAIQEELGLRKDDKPVVLKDGEGNLKGGQWEMEWVSFDRKGNVDWDKVPEKIKDEVEKYRKESGITEYPKFKIKGMDEALKKASKEGQLLGDKPTVKKVGKEGESRIMIVRKGTGK